MIAFLMIAGLGVLALLSRLAALTRILGLGPSLVGAAGSAVAAAVL